MKIVEIEWIDACVVEEHLPIKVALEQKPIKRKQVGYLLGEMPEWYEICFGMLENPNTHDMACDFANLILKGMVTSIKELT